MWFLGMLREGSIHTFIGALMWMSLASILGPDMASIGVAMFWIGREIRDFEIEALPGFVRALGLFIAAWFNRDAPKWSTDFKGFPPAMTWNLAQLRHSLSGWVPICALCLWAALRW